MDGSEIRLCNLLIRRTYHLSTVVYTSQAVLVGGLDWLVGGFTSYSDISAGI